MFWCRNKPNDIDYLSVLCSDQRFADEGVDEVEQVLAVIDERRQIPRRHGFAQAKHLHRANREQTIVAMRTHFVAKKKSITAHTSVSASVSLNLFFLIQTAKTSNDQPVACPRMMAPEAVGCPADRDTSERQHHKREKRSHRQITNSSRPHPSTIGYIQQKNSDLPRTLNSKADINSNYRSRVDLAQQPSLEAQRGAQIEPHQHRRATDLHK